MVVDTTRVRTTIGEGLQVSAQARGHVMRLDEPKGSAGDDTGMTPVEALLSGLGACKIMAAKSLQRLHKIKLNSITIDLEGEIDPAGFLGRNPKAKVGFSKIKTIYTIDADNTEEEIRDYIAFVEKNCPVLDTIVNPPEMEIEFK